jgi:hypothetical protein
LSAHHKNLFERLFVFSLASNMAFHSTVPVLAFSTRLMKTLKVI